MYKHIRVYLRDTYAYTCRVWMEGREGTTQRVKVEWRGTREVGKGEAGKKGIFKKRIKMVASEVDDCSFMERKKTPINFYYFYSTILSCLLLIHMNIVPA